MSFDKPTRNALAKMVGECRRFLIADVRDQLQRVYGLQPDGTDLPVESLGHLDERGKQKGVELREWLEHLVSTEPGHQAKQRATAFERLAHEIAFTAVNRLSALRLCEERGHVIECVRRGTESDGFKLFERLSGGALGSRATTYQAFLERMFDELAVDLGVLFDRRAPQSLVFPGEQCLDEILSLFNDSALVHVWQDDETIGWIYQYFNPKEERDAMRKASQAPRNSRELAVRNQFFTPRYVVEFLTDNTLGRMWYEMRRGDTRLTERCRYLVRRPNEIFLEPDQESPQNERSRENLSQNELLKMPLYVQFRPKKDPRDFKILDPACGSGHFLLYAFDLLELMYEEAWDDKDSPRSQVSGRTLRTDYPELYLLLREVPSLILRHNLHGIDIDPRCCQIAALALWLRVQRSYQKLALNTAERPQITRSNIVCAEPMPGELELLEEFVAALKPPLLGQLVRTVFEKMQLAGEAGSLLRVEQDIRGAIEEAKKQWIAGPAPEQMLLLPETRQRSTEPLKLFDISGITDAAFWEEAEARVIDTLREYASAAVDGESYRRRLFAEDTAQGFAFIDLARYRYDLVLMNPPFGLSQGRLYAHLTREYPESFIDLLASFVLRAKEFAPDGLVGAITSRACLYTKTLLEWRKQHLSGRISALVDLGIGVLDGAMVRACAYVLPPREGSVAGHFIDARKSNDKDVEIAVSIASLVSGVRREEAPIYWCESDFFTIIPHHRVLYWLPRDFWEKIRALPTLEPRAATVRAGLTTYDDERFLRLRWEVPSTDVGQGKSWIFISKGGYFGTFYNDVHLVVLWANDGKEVGEHNRVLYNTDAQSRRGSSYYFRPAATYSRRTDYFSAKALPDNCFFADKGPAIIPLNDTKPAYVLGLFNSDLFRGLVHAQSQGGCFETGVLKQLPWRDPDPDTQRRVESATRAAWRAKASVFAMLETDARFIQPTYARESSLKRCYDSAAERVSCANSEATTAASVISSEISALFGISSERFEDLDVLETDHEIKEATDYLVKPTAFASSIIAYAVGSALGRWDIRFATGGRVSPEPPDLFAPLPPRPPGMLRDGGVVGPSDLPDDYPIRTSWSGMLLDDAGHVDDIERRVREILEAIWKEKAEAIERETCEVLVVKNLREYFRKPFGFFADHLKRYSKSRRQAPIYWPLSTSSGSYTLWISYHQLNNDLLYKAVNDHLNPKISETERRLKQLEDTLATASGREATKLREEFESSRSLLNELQDLRGELLRVAALPYKPNLNDGVLITAAPLWRLFRLPKWRRDLEECWKKLETGKYDWAHLAYSIWPERVREKCKTDRSLAIAHGIEELCESNGEQSIPRKRRRATTKVSGPHQMDIREMDPESSDE
jgi:hypothetical protein